MDTSQNKTRILIADDHRMIRSALKNIFHNVQDMEVVAEAQNAEEVFLHLNKSNPDVMVLDLNMPEQDGLQILQQVRRENRTIPVIVLTLYPEERFKESAFQLGAVAFLTKECHPDEIINAVRKAKGAQQGGTTQK